MRNNNKSDVEARDWLEDFERTANLVDQQKQQGNASAQNESIEQLDSRLAAMEKNPTAFRIDWREVKRRRGLVDALKQEVKYIKPTVYGGGTFIRPDSHSFGSRTPGTTASSADATAQRVSRHKMLVKEQDVLVDELSLGVDRLANRANMISEESKLQVRLLDSMDSDVDKTTESLRRETLFAQQIKRKSGNCYLYICILVLSFILIMLLFFGFR
eukprot:CAMPEP_0185793364 /NCGR_PEP_ID=MMETSP1174-20130828/159430_1 /TAXON_ID=35687 /ORGANISM="Dictyocha speculum, Strain CCMP1381" /LENGTH=214 /DNA_ID=CAMNT_0028488497 /DNA_START=21 /DNA_END=665 /DNA_ORIENTATION=-